MTRKEEIWNAINNLQIGVYGENNQLDSDEYDGSDLQDAFYLGARWADDNPKSPWISVNDDLPCNHEELINSEDPNFTVSVLGRWSDEDLILPIRMTKEFTGEWEWEWELDISMSYWMPIPELPKQNSFVKV